MSTTIRLPSRYESLDPAFRGRLKPNAALNTIVKKAYRSIEINGGVRFLPIFGESGSGKSCAAREIATHLPECSVYELAREAVESGEQLKIWIEKNIRASNKKLHIVVVDQYEEATAEKESIPARFIESIALLDRDEKYKIPILFIWLTTSKTFQRGLVEATSRNRRILFSEDFQVIGPQKEDWKSIVEETFEFHNSGKEIADFGIVESRIMKVCEDNKTLGSAIERISEDIVDSAIELQDISQYRVIMLWPVTDGLRITRVTGFTNPREGYRLNWGAFYKELNEDQRNQLPLEEYNRARLYFDIRLIPIVAADIQPLCQRIEKDDFITPKSYLQRFETTHLTIIVKDKWKSEGYSPLRERESKRAAAARTWYDGGATSNPTGIGKRLAQAFRDIGLNAKHEVDIKTPNSTVRADVLIKSASPEEKDVIIELKAFSTENTRPSSIKDSIITTLKRHAYLAGFLSKS